MGITPKPYVVCTSYIFRGSVGLSVGRRLVTLILLVVPGQAALNLLQVDVMVIPKNLSHHAPVLSYGRCRREEQVEDLATAATGCSAMDSTSSYRPEAEAASRPRMVSSSSPAIARALRPASV